MDRPVFDGASFVSIDLNNGQIASRESEQLVLISAEIASMIPASDALKRAAEKWGEKHGQAFVKRHELERVGIETLSSQLGGTLAALGMGRVILEVRQNALLFRVTSKTLSPFSKGNAAMLEGFISGYLSVIMGQQFKVLELGDIKGDHLFFAGNETAVTTIQTALNAGTKPLAAVDGLMAERDAAC